MAGWAAYAKHRDIFKSNIAICLKRHVYNSSVPPAMTYGAETWTPTKQAQNKLAAAQTKMERSMLDITYKYRRTNIWVRERTKLIDIIYTVRKNEMVLGRAYQPPQRWPIDLARHHLETIWHENTTRETSQAVERRPGQILERHDMAEETTGHNGCLMMMKSWTRKIMNSTVLPSFHFGMNRQCFAAARLTWRAYDNGRELENSSTWKDRIDV